MNPEMIKNRPITQKKKSGKNKVLSKRSSVSTPAAEIARIIEQRNAYSEDAHLQDGLDPKAFIAPGESFHVANWDDLANLARLVILDQEKLIKRISEIEKENEHLRSLLLTDDLTGLYNKRFFTIQLEVEMARTRRTGQPCTLMMMDLDNFKILNDGLGHDTGDRFLIQIGEIIKGSLRPTDFACRFGGDEFTFIMTASSMNDSIGVAKRIQIAMAKLTAKLPDDIGKQLSSSFGLATYENLAPLTADFFFKQADVELYNAKKRGKNQISCGRGIRTDLTAVSVEEKAALSRPIFETN
jgi:diguanylate cyclase (GGDEF)-like protein